eukprot:13357172-Alexandrium_andersonii.AAC.1
MQDWWREPAKRLETWRSALRPLILLIDANARVGEAPNPSVGERAAEPEGDLSLAFKETFRKARL